MLSPIIKSPNIDSKCVFIDLLSKLIKCQDESIKTTFFKAFLSSYKRFICIFISDSLWFIICQTNTDPIKKSLKGEPSQRVNVFLESVVNSGWVGFDLRIMWITQLGLHVNLENFFGIVSLVSQTWSNFFLSKKTYTGP